MLSAPSTHFGTGKSATLPPGKSKAWALRTLKDIPGARKVGRDWVVSVEAFDAWATEQDTARCSGKRPPSKQATPDVEALADAALLEGGFRRARAR